VFFPAVSRGRPRIRLFRGRAKNPMPPIMRLAETGDAEQVRAIYAPSVTDSAISFESEVPPVSEMAERIRTTLERFPWLVCEHEGNVLGYAYAGPHERRVAYQWSVEVSVYIRADAHRRGVGRGIYRSLLSVLELQGFHRAYAGVTLPNPASVGLHEPIGFERLGVYRDVGYKFGDWHDVGWWQLSLKEKSGPPDPPTPISDVVESKAWQEAIDEGLGLLRL